MYLFKFVIFLSCILILGVSGAVYVTPFIQKNELSEWVQQNWIITSLSVIGVLAVLWVIRKMLKGLIYIAGVGLAIYYAVTYGPAIYDFLKPFGFFNLAFLLLLLPFTSEKFRDLLWDWNLELEYRVESKLKSQKNVTPTSLNFATEVKSFEAYVKEKAHNEIQQVALAKYNEFAKKYGNVGFGESGANEFVGATLLAKYRPALEKNIDEGIGKVFQKAFSPLQFSDYMDGVVNQSDVPYSTWSNVYNYLKSSVLWIKNHEVSGYSSVIAPDLIYGKLGSFSPTNNQNLLYNKVYRVVGVAYDNRQSVIKTLDKGDGVLLVHEPNHPYDKNAIHVLDDNNCSIGYISRSDNQTLIPLLKGKSSIRALVDRRYRGPSGTNYWGIKIRLDNAQVSQAVSSSFTNNRTYSQSNNYDDYHQGSLDYDDYNEDGVPYRDLRGDDDDFYGERYH